MLPFTKRNVRSEDEQEELLETGEIEVVQTELRAAVEGVRPQIRARAEQPAGAYGSRRTAVRKIGGGAGPASSASGPLSVQGGPRHHSSLGASVSLGAINQALGAMNTEPAFGDRDRDRDDRPSSRAVVRTPAPAPSPLSQPNPVSSRVAARTSTHVPSPTAAMPSPLPPPPSPPHSRRDEEATMARPISSPPPPINARTRARMAPPPAGIAVPTPFDELEEQTNAVMPLMAMSAPLGEITDEMPTAMQLQTPPTIMAGSAAMPAAFRAQVLQQMQAARAGQSTTAMDQLIAQQLANVQRAQPIPAPEATQLSAAAVPAPRSSARALAPLAPPSPATATALSIPMPGAIRPPGSPLSASNVDPPGTVVTARTRTRFGSPALSWTAGLLVVGACVGAAVFVMWRNDSRAEAAAQSARGVQAAAAAQQAQMAATGTYLGANGANGATGTSAPVADPSAITAPPQAAPFGGIPANGSVAAANTAALSAPSASTTAADAALTAAALNDGTTGMGGTLAPGNGTQPVMQLTPAQLAVMTGGAPGAAAAPPPATTPAPGSGSGSGSASDSDGASHHHHTHAPVAASDAPAPAPRPAPVAAAPAPAPRPAPVAQAPAPKPTPVPKKSAAAAPAAGADDMDSAAKALAKAQLEQSL